MLNPSARLRPKALRLPDHRGPLLATSDTPRSTGAWALPFGAGRDCLALPFDALRLQYAGAVTAGLVPLSILASGQLERALDVLEKLILGPLARQR